MHRELAAGDYIGSVTRRSEYWGAMLSEIRHSRARSLPAHEQRASYFSVLLAGEYGESIGSLALDYRPFSLGFHPAGLQHRDQVGEGGARFFNIDLSEVWVQRWAGQFDRALATGPRLLSHAAVLLVARLYALHRDGQTMLDVVDGALCELLAEVAKGECSPESHRPGWLPRCVDLLHAAIDRPITIADIAHTLELHPGYLSREFRRRHGCGVGEYLQRLRISAACRSLATADRSLADIASATGFSDQSHFTRVFGSVVGCSPGRFRGLLRDENALKG